MAKIVLSLIRRRLRGALDKTQMPVSVDNQGHNSLPVDVDDSRAGRRLCRAGRNRANTVAFNDEGCTTFQWGRPCRLSH